jgi:hypothetical protein
MSEVILGKRAVPCSLPTFLMPHLARFAQFHIGSVFLNLLRLLLQEAPTYSASSGLGEIIK